jgi:hypothetical protein
MGTQPGFMRDNYKGRNDPLRLETNVQEDDMHAREMATNAADAAPPKSDFARFMSRYGWGIVAMLVILAIFGRLIWTLWSALE